jgi:hypothetical protein
MPWGGPLTRHGPPPSSHCLSSSHCLQSCYAAAVRWPGRDTVRAGMRAGTECGPGPPGRDGGGHGLLLSSKEGAGGAAAPPRLVLVLYASVVIVAVWELSHSELSHFGLIAFCSSEWCGATPNAPLSRGHARTAGPLQDRSSASR